MEIRSCLLYTSKIVFIDYLQQLRGRGRDRFEQVTNISLDLHAMAQTHGILVVALSQLCLLYTSIFDLVPNINIRQLILQVVNKNIIRFMLHELHQNLAGVFAKHKKSHLST